MLDQVSQELNQIEKERKTAANTALDGPAI